MSECSSVVFLKTSAGRRLTLSQPITVQKLVDAAVNQLLYDGDTVKFFFNGAPLFDRSKKYTDLSGDELHQELPIPNEGDIILIGRLRSCVTRHKTAEASQSKAKTVESREAQQVCGFQVHSPRFSTQSLETNFTGNGETSDVVSGSGDLYDFMKHFVFLRGRRGLRQMLYIARNQYGDFPRSLQDHQTMVSIVEYVSRNPKRLKEVLRTIMEEEPDFFKWIEANPEVFLAIINDPVHLQDEMSPALFIRDLISLFYRKTANCDEQEKSVKPLLQATAGGNDSPQQNSENNLSTTSRLALLRGLAGVSETVEGLPASQGLFKDAEHMSDGAKVSSLVNDSEFGVVDPVIMEVQATCESWVAAKERWCSSVEGSKNIHVMNHLMSARLCEAQSSLLQCMENCVVSPFSLATLQKLCVDGNKLWEDGEQWLVSKNDLSNAFQSALGRLLFVAGRDLLTDFLDVKCGDLDSQQCREPATTAKVERHPLLDPTTRWITPNGPEALAGQLREYSITEDVCIVIYVQCSSGHARAYAVRDGRVDVGPLVVDDAAKREMEELELLYSLFSTGETALQDPGKRCIIQESWNDLMVRLYKRFISPIAALLPHPVNSASALVTDVQQVCFIDTLSPKHVPIPFSALINPEDSRPCALQWASFVAHRPWHLILSAGLPWSPVTVRSPVITRLATPAAPSQQTSDNSGRVCLGVNMVTYVNTDGTHCSSFGEVPSNQSLVAPDNEPGVIDGGLWQDVPWRGWLREVLGGVRAGIPTHASLYGRDPGQANVTALLIHEVTPVSLGGSAGTTSKVAKGTCSKGCSPVDCREVPYNQNSDLFVSHVVGRESGIGTHRCALLRTFKAGEHGPTDIYNAFFRILAEENTTTAKAYRLALLELWGNCSKDEPWHIASVSLNNYGGLMKTLAFLSKGESSPAAVADEHAMDTKLLSLPNKASRVAKKKNRRSLPIFRDTCSGHYVEGRAIDVIYDAVLNGLSARRPEGMVAILDCMIGCIEKNRVTLERSARKRCEKKNQVSGRSWPSPGSESASPRGPVGKASLVESIREKVAVTKNSHNNAETEGTEGVVLPPVKGEKCPSLRKPRQR